MENAELRNYENILKRQFTFQLPTSLPVWFEDSKPVAALKAGELTEKEDRERIFVRMPGTNGGQDRNLEILPISLVGRNKWQNSVESNEKVVIRI